jgi:molybdenum cofactor cytidylyltransferase
MSSTARAAAIVPAAGASRRMGKPKLLLPWGESTVLESTLAALREGGVPTIVVVIAPAGPLAEWQPPAGVRTAVNPEPAAGMLSSILVGLAALATTPDDEALGAGISTSPQPKPDPLVVCPADLPALRPSTVAALLAAYRTTGGVVVPRHGRRRGHPLLIPPRWQARMPELARHEGGLRRILELAAGSVHEIVVDDPGSVRDVDTPEDYVQLAP